MTSLIETVPSLSSFTFCQSGFSISPDLIFNRLNMSCLDSFLMVAKDQQAFDELIFLKGEDLDWFFQSALPSEETELTIVDYLGYSWKCGLKFIDGREVACIISGQWKQLCDARKFNEGATVKFGVPYAANNRTMYMLPPPMMVLRTRLPSSSIPGVNHPIYTLEQYFWNK